MTSKLKLGDRVCREVSEYAGYIARIAKRESQFEPRKEVLSALVAWMDGTASWHPCKHLKRDE